MINYMNNPNPKIPAATSIFYMDNKVYPNAPLDGDVVMSSHSGQMYHSSDMGKTWSMVFNDANANALSQMTMDDKGRIFCTVSNSSLNVPSLYLSEDKGLTYRLQTLPSFADGTKYAESIVTFGDNIFVGGGTGFLVSTDAGKNFTTRVTAGMRHYYMYRHEPNGYILSVSSNATGIRRSTDNGATWGPTNLTSLSYASICYGNGCILSGGSSGNIARSIDGGQTFTLLAPNGLDNTYIFHAENDTFFSCAYGKGLYISHDAGETWSQTGLTSGNVRGGIYLGYGVILLSDYAAKVYRSTDMGATFETIPVVGSPRYFLSIPK